MVDGTAVAMAARLKVKVTIFDKHVSQQMTDVVYGSWGALSRQQYNSIMFYIVTVFK